MRRKANGVFVQTELPDEPFDWKTEIFETSKYDGGILG